MVKNFLMISLLCLPRKKKSEILKIIQEKYLKTKDLALGLYCLNATKSPSDTQCAAFLLLFPLLYMFRPGWPCHIVTWTHIAYLWRFRDFNSAKGFMYDCSLPYLFTVWWISLFCNEINISFISRILFSCRKGRHQFCINVVFLHYSPLVYFFSLCFVCLLWKLSFLFQSDHPKFCPILSLNRTLNPRWPGLYHRTRQSP